jgi:hypothetical protein
MTEAMGAAGGARGEVWRRAGVTIALVAVYWLARRVPLPFVDPGRSAAWWAPRLLALGLEPFLYGFLTAEFLALLVPALQRRRHGSAADRAPLERAAWGLALLIASVQAIRITASMVELSASSPYLSGPRIAPGPAAPACVALTLVGGTALVGFLAASIGRFGLGNGFAVLFAASFLARLPSTLSAGLLGKPDPASRGTSLLFVALGLLALPWFLSRLLRGSSSERRWVALPTCGLVPLLLASWVLSLPVRYRTWSGWVSPWSALLPANVLERVQEPVDQLVAKHGPFVDVAVTVASALILGLAFSRPSSIRAAWSAAGVAEPPDDFTIRDELAKGHVLSIAAVAALVAIPPLLGVRSHSLMLGVAIVVAVALDLVAEARARRRGDLQAVYPLHQVHAVEPVLAALEAAGIRATARARYYRALFHFFTPYASIDLLVPPERAEEAAAICARVARAAPAPEPSPT